MARGFAPHDLQVMAHAQLEDQSIALTLKTDGRITVHGGNVHVVDQKPGQHWRGEMLHVKPGVPTEVGESASSLGGLQLWIYHIAGDQPPNIGCWLIAI